MKRIAVLLVASAFLALAGTAVAGKYQTYISCAEGQPPARSCDHHYVYGAQFQTKDGNPARYKLCARRVKSEFRPIKWGKRKCERRMTDEEGYDYVVLHRFDYIGPIKVSWRVGGKLIDKGRVYAW